jgi:uncharacterized damage-inducible protein DinB
MLEQIRHHVAHTAWAGARLVDAVSSLTPEELNRDFGTAGKSILGSLFHVLAADRIWLSRIRGRQPDRFIHPAKDMHLAVLRNDWPPLLAEWKSYVGGLTAHDLSSVIEYHDIKGNPHRTHLWQILLHLVNHGTRHRGQAPGFLRMLGRTPPPLDLIACYGQLPS